jgi:hypothetical protein
MPMTLIGPFNTGLAVGAPTAATIYAVSPVPIRGYLDSIYVKYNINELNIIINGTFTGDTDWTKGANWTIPAANKATAAAAVLDLVAAVAPLTIGHSYNITYTVAVTGGGVRVTDGVTNGSTRTVSGTYTETFVAGATAFKFHPTAAFTGTIDNVIVYDYEDHLGADVIVETAGTNAPAYTLLTLTDTIVLGNVWVAPRKVPHSTLGVALIALTIAEPFPVYDYIKVTIDQAVAGDNLDVWLMVDAQEDF